MGADRRVGLASGGEQPMDPLAVVGDDTHVTSPAGLGDVEVVDRGVRIARGKDPVGRLTAGVTVVAGRGDVDPALGRLVFDSN